MIFTPVGWSDDLDDVAQSPTDGQSSRPMRRSIEQASPLLSGMKIAVLKFRARKPISTSLFHKS
jgi:hypothetical protein